MYNDFHSFFVDYDDESVASYDNVSKYCLAISFPIAASCYFFGWVPLAIALAFVFVSGAMQLAKDAHRR